MSKIITLTTDFGWRDGYVGAMKGVILSINPQAVVVDIAHEIEAHDVLEASIVVRSACRYFPAGTIHLVVVDPGVGSERRPILLQTDRYVFIGPDNGVLSLAAEEKDEVKVIELGEGKYWLTPLSDTFHGRDIFAPVAGYLSLGVDPECLGAVVRSYHKISVVEPVVTESEVQGKILAVDRFGNLVTNISRDLFNAWAGDGHVSIEVGRERLEAISRSYAEVSKGSVLAIWGSSGYLEIAAKQDRADLKLGLGRNGVVQVRRTG